jgi:hypothetical protein
MRIFDEAVLFDFIVELLLWYLLGVNDLYLLWIFTVFIGVIYEIGFDDYCQI